MTVLSVGAAGRSEAEPAGVAGTDRCGARFDHEHAAWSAILDRYVRAGFVDNAGLKHGGRPDLSAYLSGLESVCRADHDSWTREQKLAFWINVYNAYTVKLIVDRHPLRSIRSIGFLPGSAFRKEIIPLRKLRGWDLSLDDVEHEILRRELREPRIHFAIVCASKSCPALRSVAYRARDLEAQLEDAARSFVRDPTKNRFDAVARKLRLSSIFKGFREDFELAAGSVQAFVARYADAATAAAIRAGGVRIEFLDYDWSLKGK